MSTCNRLDLQTLGSPPVIMPKYLPDHRDYCNTNLDSQLLRRLLPGSGVHPLLISRCGTTAREEPTVSCR